MHVSEILLRPKAHNNRIARAEDLETARGEGGCIAEPELSCKPFGSIMNVVAAIAEKCGGTEYAGKIHAACDQLVRFSMCREDLNEVTSLNNASLAINGTHAALRRVTRETTPVCVAIDRTARALLGALHHLRVSKFSVKNVENIDRLSLKILVRASLLDEKSSRIIWAWDIPSIKDSQTLDGDISSALALEVRYQFLETIKRVLCIDETSHRTLSVNEMSVEQFDQRDRSSIGLASYWLSVQKYDSALTWAGARSALPAKLECDALRIFAMAATNAGFHESSLRAFSEAEKMTTDQTTRAHLLYMQGLLQAKRKRDLVASDDLYRRGLEALAAARADDPGDVDVERAWLYNGMALNTLLKARLQGASPATVFSEAFGLLKNASHTVRDGASSDRVYLRFNLLKNMSNLLEIQGKFHEALYALEAAFDSDIHELPGSNDWNAHLATRKAALLTRTSQFERAISIYEATVTYLHKSDQDVCIEVVRRSLGTAALMSGELGLAQTHFEEGMSEALAARSLLGLQTHGLGMLYVLAKQGKHHIAADRAQQIADEEGVRLIDVTKSLREQLDQVTIPPRLYGLPTSLPEIDLENVSAVSVSRTLHGGTSRTSAEVAMTV